MSLLLILFVYLSSAGQAANSTIFINSISNQSMLMAKAIENENELGVIVVFDENASLLPEYHHTLEGSKLIGNYYKEFFKKTRTLMYSKKPFEIMVLGDDYYAELGTFKHQYITPKGETFDYNGKYSTYWKINREGKPVIKAHILGSSSYFESEMVDFIYINDRQNKPIDPKTDWERKIEERRAFIYEAVLAGDADLQLTSYHDDAIYMTYYDPPFIGKDKISEYYRSHYNPDVVRDSLMTTTIKVIEMGEYALKFGEYYVSWIFEGQGYFIYGKGLTLYKQSDDGPIKIYRQMINHSMPAVLKSEGDEFKVLRILRHLDNQDIDTDEYLSVYNNEDLEVMPPNHARITGKKNFKSFLIEERKKGNIKITHGLQDLQSMENLVIVSGKSNGTFISKADNKPYPFQTNNLMVFEKNENGELTISKLIWNLVPTE